ncbi:MAG: PaaI family thioesterase [Pseudomonadota bacterium]|nr:PaaI family thioesterase [Pseudomonadota bacterium]
MQDQQPQPRYTVVEEGEFAGWRRQTAQRFLEIAGPAYSRREEDRSITTAMRAEERHLNGLGVVHGGALMSLADNALFNIATDALKGSDWSVTVTMNTEFLDAAQMGDLIVATGEVVRAGGSMIFVRGIVKAEGRPCLAFSGTIKKGKRRG